MTHRPPARPASCPPALEAARAALADFEPPPGAGQRVRRGVRQRLRRRRRFPIKLALLALPATAAAALTAQQLFERQHLTLEQAAPSEHAPAKPEHAPAKRAPRPSAVAANVVPASAPPHAADDTLPTSTAQARPVRRARFANRVVVAPPKARRRRARPAPQMPPASLRPAPPALALSPATAPVATSTPAPTEPRKTTADDALAREVAAYERAQRIARGDHQRALAVWLALRRRWPDGILRHEIDLRVIAALVEQHHPDARREAKAFVRRHPHSPRAKEMSQLARRLHDKK